MVCSQGSHTVYCHRYHIVFETKYRYDVLKGELKVRIGRIIRQTCNELGVEIVKGVLSTDQVHTFIAVPPKPYFIVGPSRGKQAAIRRKTQAPDSAFMAVPSLEKVSRDAIPKANHAIVGSSSSTVIYVKVDSVDDIMNGQDCQKFIAGDRLLKL